MKQWREENKEHRAEQSKQYYEENKERINERSNQWYQENKERRNECSKQYRQENRERINEHAKQFYQENRERIKQYHEENRERILTRMKQYREENKEQMKQYREENKERIVEYQKQWRKENKEYQKQWREENKERIYERINEYTKQRRLTDPLYKLKCNLRSRTIGAFKRKSYLKTSKTAEMLGVPYEVAFAHIERQFTKGMTWENQGEWHIDHIIPLASAQTESELIKLCHYTNLQPLWAFDNISKSDNLIDGTQVKLRL